MYKNYFKRLLDFFIGIVLSPLLLFLIIFVWVMIKLEDNGPIFYLGKRLGKNGKVFKMYKFRSMKMNAPDIRNEDGSTFNSEDDPRHTRIGKFIRKTSLDEIPQIINIIKGDMSFVGPRPDLPEHIEVYNNEELRKLEVLPGVTGFNQAYFRNSIEWKDRLKNDVYYTENISFLMDLKIVVKTIGGVLLKKGIFVEENKHIGG